MLEQILGYVAAILTTIAFLPQVIKVVKTKSTTDISLGMFVIFCLGIFMWFLYGLMGMYWPVIVANLVTFFLALTILIYKLKYK